MAGLNQEQVLESMREEVAETLKNSRIRNNSSAMKTRVTSWRVKIEDTRINNNGPDTRATGEMFTKSASSIKAVEGVATTLPEAVAQQPELKTKELREKAVILRVLGCKGKFLLLGRVEVGIKSTSRICRVGRQGPPHQHTRIEDPQMWVKIRKSIAISM